MAWFKTKTERFEAYDRISPAKFRSDFVGKNVLVTGGGFGIGVAIARSFGEAQVARIIIAGRTGSKLEAVQQQLAKAYPETKIEYHMVDVASEDSVKALFAAIKTPLDILVNNAGYLANPENFVHANLKEWWRAYEVNVLGTALITQQFLQARAKQQASEQAVIINMNSLGALNVLGPDLSAYSGSKAALWRMMETISVDLNDSSILPGGARVVSVHPGSVKSAMNDKSGISAWFPYTSEQLAGEFTVWTATQEASFLANRMAFANWDVDELVAIKEEILEKDKLRTAMS